MNGPGKPRTLTSQVSGADLSRDGANIGIWNIQDIDICLINTEIVFKEWNKNQVSYTFIRNKIKFMDSNQEWLKINLNQIKYFVAKYLFHL